MLVNARCHNFHMFYGRYVLKLIMNNSTVIVRFDDDSPNQNCSNFDSERIIKSLRL